MQFEVILMLEAQRIVGRKASEFLETTLTSWSIITSFSFEQVVYSENQRCGPQSIIIEVSSAESYGGMRTPSPTTHTSVQQRPQFSHRMDITSIDAEIQTGDVKYRLQVAMDVTCSSSLVQRRVRGIVIPPAGANARTSQSHQTLLRTIAPT